VPETFIDVVVRVGVPVADEEVLELEEEVSALLDGAVDEVFAVEVSVLLDGAVDEVFAVEVSTLVATVDVSLVELDVVATPELLVAPPLEVTVDVSVLVVEMAAHDLTQYENQMSSLLVSVPRRSTPDARPEPEGHVEER